MQDEHLSFDVEDLDRDALLDEAVRAVQEDGVRGDLTRSARNRSFGTPEVHHGISADKEARILAAWDAR